MEAKEPGGCYNGQESSAKFTAANKAGKGLLGNKDFSSAAAGQTLRQTATNAGNRWRLTLSVLPPPPKQFNIFLITHGGLGRRGSMQFN